MVTAKRAYQPRHDLKMLHSWRIAEYQLGLASTADHDGSQADTNARRATSNIRFSDLVNLAFQGPFSSHDVLATRSTI